MKRAETEMRAEYSRADFTTLERGKFLKETMNGAYVALIHPKISRAFTSSKSTGEILSGLLQSVDKKSPTTTLSNGFPVCD
jgi:hypothetical protein